MEYPKTLRAPGCSDQPLEFQTSRFADACKVWGHWEDYVPAPLFTEPTVEQGYPCMSKRTIPARRVCTQ
jgi:hypothetical protein